jgi:arabinogalactan oligomer/maltooligosaccharide transport system substrate-binding protein
MNGGYHLALTGSWNLRPFQQNLGRNFGVDVLPAGPNGPAAPFVGYDGFFLNPNSQNIPAAVSLIQFMTSPESAQYFSDIGGQLPVRTDVASNDPLFAPFQQSAASGVFRPFSPDSEFRAIFDNMYIQVLENSIPAEQAVQDACQAWDDFLGN